MMKQKIILTVLFVLSLMTMILPWFGYHESEIVYGTILLHNPISVTCIFLVFIGIWHTSKTGDILGNIGLIGIVAMQIYECLTWHILTMTGQLSISLSLSLCYPEFYFACLCMIVMLVIYRIYYRQYSMEYYYSSISI